MFKLNNLPWNCSNYSCLKFALREQTCHFLPVWLSIHTHMQHYLFQYHLTQTSFIIPQFTPILWYLLVSLPNGFPYISSNCLLIYLVSGVKFIVFNPCNTFFPLLAFSGSVLYWMQLNSASSSWRSFIFYFCSSITPIYCVSTLTFCKGGTYSQPADTADAGADEDVAVVLEHFFSHVIPPLLMNNAKSR